MRRWVILAVVLACAAGAWVWRSALLPHASPDLILISIDTLRADHLGAYGHAAARTPNLDRIAREGALFTHAYSAVPITLPSHATMLSGLNPPQHGARDNGSYRVPDSITTVAERLRDGGYATGAFIAGEPLVRSCGLAQGFDHYDDAMSERGLSPTQKAARPERYAEEVFERARDWLVNATPERPVFLFIHLYDPHEPYEKSLAGAKEPSYDGEIAYVDQSLGRFLSAIELNPRWKRATLIITSDHGEALGEHGEKTHCVFVYDSTLRVPLLVRGAEVSERREIAAPVGLVDVAPTLVELAGLPPLAPCDGRSLRSLLRGGAAEERELYFESLFGELRFGWAPLRGVRQNALKYIDAPRAELYDTAPDPRELENLLASRPADAQALAARTRAAGLGMHARTAVDRETLAELAKLGYVSAPPIDVDDDGVRADPKDEIATYDRFQAAHLDFLSGDVQGSLDLMASLEKSLERSPYFYLDWGNFAAAAQQWPLAKTAYEKCLALNPGERDARLNLGTVHLNLNEPERALESFAAVLASWPEDPDALLFSGLVKLRNLHDRSGAVSYWKRFLEVAPLDPRAAEIRRGLAQIGNQ